MSWEASTYLSRKVASDLGSDQHPPMRIAGNVPQALCPGCRQYVLPFRLADLTATPAAFRAIIGDINFACDGCWSGWIRNSLIIPDGRPLTESILYELMGAPPEFVEKVEAIEAYHGAKRLARDAAAVFDPAAFDREHSALIDKMHEKAGRSLRRRSAE